MVWWLIWTRGFGPADRAGGVGCIAEHRDAVLPPFGRARGEPATFPLNQVIPGWTEGVQLMPVGSKFKFFLPSKLAYGEHGAGSIPANAVLVFDVELLAIEKPAADGADAKK